MRSTVACMTSAGISALHMAGVSRSRLASNSRAFVRNVLHCVMDDKCIAIASCACSSVRTSLLACGMYSMQSDEIVMSHDCLGSVKHAQRHGIRPADAADWHLSVRLLSALLVLHWRADKPLHFGGTIRRKSARGGHKLQKAAEICMTTQSRPVRVVSGQNAYEFWPVTGCAQDPR